MCVRRLPRDERQQQVSVVSGRQTCGGGKTHTHIHTRSHKSRVLTKCDCFLQRDGVEDGVKVIITIPRFTTQQYNVINSKLVTLFYDFLWLFFRPRTHCCNAARHEL